MKAEKPILIASDHAGVDLKMKLQTALKAWKWDDLGPFDSASVDYPDYAEKLSRKIADGKADFGILICGSGIGMSIAANRIPGVRAAVVTNPVAARLSREHNHANVLCLGARFLGMEYAIEITETWLKTPFNTDNRHNRRVVKIETIR